MGHSYSPILIAAALLIALPIESNAAYKCVSSEGKVAFQDFPCTRNSKTPDPIKLSENPDQPATQASNDLEPLHFGTSAVGNFVVASSTLRLLASSGYDCETWITISAESERTAVACRKFLRQYRAWFEPARKQLVLVLEDKDWYALNASDARKAVKDLEKASGHHTFATLHYRSR